MIFDVHSHAWDFPLNDMLAGTALPRLNEQEIESLIHRNGFRILGV